MTFTGGHGSAGGSWLAALFGQQEEADDDFLARGYGEVEEAEGAGVRGGVNLTDTLLALDRCGPVTPRISGFQTTAYSIFSTTRFRSRRTTNTNRAVACARAPVSVCLTWQGERVI